MLCSFQGETLGQGLPPSGKQHWEDEIPCTRIHQSAMGQEEELIAEVGQPLTIFIDRLFSRIMILKAPSLTSQNWIVQLPTDS